MKKTTIITLLLFAALPLLAEHVDPETAQKAAANFLSNNGVKSDQLTDLSKAAGFPNLYIFNGEEGFVVMSADDCAKPILGYSLTGTFDIDNMPENLRWWLQQYNDEIQWAVDNGITSEKSAIDWRELNNGEKTKGVSSVVVNPLLSTTWNQSSPYNYYCPSGTVTGCVATAMAQVMKYWNYPEQGQGSHTNQNNTSQTIDFSTATYDWNNMLDSYSGSYNDTQRDAVATLMFHCGVSVDMKYGPSATGGSEASGTAVPIAFIEYFKYAPTATFIWKQSYTNEQWITLLKTELDEARPVFYGGSFVTDTDSGGHAFVCDGYRSDDYFHFNWGWGGYKDGYFAIGALNPNPSSGNATGSGLGTYNVNNGMIVWLEPTSTLSAPTISSTASNGTITISWTAIDDAISYDVFRDDERIGTGITGNSFVDTDIEFGIYHDYYVRAISSSTHSNNSNHTRCGSFHRNLTPSNLSANVENGDAVLTWTGPSGNLTSDLHYGTNISPYLYGTDTVYDAYWAHRYPSSTVSNLAGMHITKISSSFYLPGNYTMYLFSGNVNEDTRTKLAEQTITKTDTGLERIDIPLNPHINFDLSKDLWVVFFADKSIPYPITIEYPYSYDDANDAKYLSHALDSVFFSDNTASDPVSWIINTYVSDGTYTYNLYDGNTKVNGDVPISGTSYSITEALDEGIHQFTVKTNYTGGESAASNKAGVVVGTPSLETLVINTDDAMTLSDGSTLTVSGNITNTNPANLIIEEGGQLIHPNCAVQATMKKNINAYSNVTGVNEGWYTIASPIDNYDVGNITLGDYDLYAYDEKNEYWRNQKVSANNITEFKEGKGFLYANAATTPLAFVGNMKATNEQVTVTLSCKSSDENLKGFNLVGNPFSRNIGSGEITLNGQPVTTYYSVEGGTDLVSHSISANPIKPGQGFLVQATSDGQELVFNPSSTKGREDVKPSYISIEASDDSFTDRAIVQFGEGNTLHKTTLSDNTLKLSVWHHNANYATVIVNDENELPLLFNAIHDGLHTLSVSIENLNLDYLHLIDNLTGANIDLLATPSYSFEAKESDYPSRFRLVFSKDGIIDPAEYDSDFIDGKTQILDMTGRVVATDRNAKLASGVYLLRTINDNDIKTEKIVVR